MQVADGGNLDVLRYPVGRFSRPAQLSDDERARALDILERLPEDLRAAVAELSDAELDTPYREGGWTLRQVVHHVADSHLNAYARMRLALTEDWPMIKPYEEAAWAELEDARTMPVSVSLGLLDALHARWLRLLRAVPAEAWQGRGYRHPETGEQTLGQVLALYAWHSRHHVGHIKGAQTGARADARERGTP